MPRARTDLARRFLLAAQERGLSEREATIASELLGPLRIEDVAVRLGMPAGTAKTYARRTYRKFDVRSRREFCAMIIQRLSGGT